MPHRDPRPFLTVSHYIYLTREQRYQLADGLMVEVVGVSVPVWFKSGNTSEPAKEVFCKYILSSDIQSYGVSSFSEGYKINLRNLDKSVSLNMLFDIKDRGIEEFIAKGYDKIVVEGKTFSAFHCLEIKPIELLVDTLCDV